MNKMLVTGVIMAVTGFSSQAVSTEAQIDALQNEILKIKQDMASDKSKAYFKKGKGLSIKSSDGKFSFEIKGRLMYDLSAITAGNDTVDNPSRADNIGTFGNEFRRARFTIKGEVGDGWKVALTTLMNERLAVGDASGVDFQEIFELTKESDFNGENAISNGGVREKLADWYCEYAGLKYTKMRNISALSRGDTPGPDASITKIVSANKLQDIANFGMDLMDNASIVKSDDKDDIRALFQGSLLGAPLIRIAGGTDEILRNIIAEQVLGMPQDVRIDKTVPFNEIPSGSKN